MNKSSLSAHQKEALGMLLNDHRHVQKLFKEFKGARSPEDKATIARQICSELRLHTRLEEELAYPAFRKADPDTFDKLVNEAIVEHGSAKELIAQIEDINQEDELFDARVTVLGEYISHHIKEEEEQLFPKVVDKKLDLRELGQRMEARREELASVTGSA